jgi:Rha family phage regulatory protein
MTNPLDLVCLKNGQPVTSSFQIAEHFGKAHKHVLESIRALECSTIFRESNFRLTYEIKTIGNSSRKTPCYEVTRDGFTLLCMGFVGQAAMQWKEAYIAAFNQIEARAMLQHHLAYQETQKLKLALLAARPQLQLLKRYDSLGLDVFEQAKLLEVSPRKVRTLIREARSLGLMESKPTPVHQLSLLGE